MIEGGDFLLKPSISMGNLGKIGGPWDRETYFQALHPKWYKILYNEALWGDLFVKAPFVCSGGLEA